MHEGLIIVLLFPYVCVGIEIAKKSLMITVKNVSYIPRHYMDGPKKMVFTMALNWATLINFPLNASIAIIGKGIKFGKNVTIFEERTSTPAMETLNVEEDTLKSFFVSSIIFWPLKVAWTLTVLTGAGIILGILKIVEASLAHRKKGSK